MILFNNTQVGRFSKYKILCTLQNKERNAQHQAGYHSCIPTVKRSLSSLWVYPHQEYSGSLETPNPTYQILPLCGQLYCPISLRTRYTAF